MPRYGEAAVVSKAWQDDRPILSAALPAAALGVGGLKLKSAIRPDAAGQIRRAEGKVQSAADSMVSAHQAQQAAKLKGQTVPTRNPLKKVGRKTVAASHQHRAGWRATQKFIGAETDLANAQRNLNKVKTITAPRSMIPRVRRGRAALGGALLTGGAIGAYRRLGPRPAPQGSSNA